MDGASGEPAVEGVGSGTGEAGESRVACRDGGYVTCAAQTSGPLLAGGAKKNLLEGAHRTD